jgi:hypothetical protein
VHPAPERTVEATVTIRPDSVARDTAWLTATAWQGGGLIVEHLVRVAPGVFRTTRALPVHGKWKSLIRMSDGRALQAVPVYMPADPAIPAPAVPARARAVRPFVADKDILQREARGGALAAVLPAYLVLALVFCGEFTVLVLALQRVRRTALGEPASRPRRHSGRRPRTGLAPTPQA